MSADLVVWSFSGGRTSGFMVANYRREGQPVVFCNTGLEEEQTLQFVQDCDVHYGLDVVWLEYHGAGRFRRVNFSSASRGGEPFSKLLADRRFLPNPRMRFCTSELKVRTVERWVREAFPGVEGYDSCIGIRADEPARVARIRARAASNKDGGLGTAVLPLAADGVSVADVHRWWQNQPVRLKLASDGVRTFAGNCSLCFMKPAAQIVSLVREKPSRAVWWIAAETAGRAWTDGAAATFRNDRPAYAALALFAAAQGELFDTNDQTDCVCGEGESV